ncbi:MAG TPA: hypothetical protein VFM96_10465 [Gaiellaceae bacterium]|nr:hypothetical protein [Gaiellaceae bacterium]
MGELADTVREPWRRPGEVGIAVHDHRAHREAQVVRALDRLLEAEPTCRHDDQLRLLAEDGLPRGREGVLARLAEDVRAARGVHHLRKPVTRSVWRIHPFRNEHARPLQSRDSFAHRVDLLARLLCDGDAALAHAQPIGQRDHALDDVVEAARIHREHLGADRTRGREVAARHRAHLAEILRDHEIRLELVHQLCVDRIDRMALRRRRADDRVDLGSGETRYVDPRARDQRLGGGLGWPVAILRDTDERIEQAELGDHVGRARQQGDDPHARTVTRRGSVAGHAA